MDLTTLPSEMFAKVLKRTESGKLNEMRKMNKLVNQIALNYRPILPVAKHFRLTMWNRGKILKLCILFKDGVNYKELNYELKLVQNEDKVVQFIKYHLAQFRAIKCISIHRMSLTKELLQFFAQIPGIFRREIEINRCNIHGSSKKSAQLVRAYKESKIIDSKWVDRNYLPTDKILCKLIPTSSIIFGQWRRPLPGVTDETLRALGTHIPPYLSLRFQTNFTCEEVVRLIEKTFYSGKLFEYNLGTFDVGQREDSIVLEETIQSVLSEMQEVHMTVRSDQRSAKYNIKSPMAEGLPWNYEGPKRSRITFVVTYEDEEEDDLEPMEVDREPYWARQIEEQLPYWARY